MKPLHSLFAVFLLSTALPATVQADAPAASQAIAGTIKLKPALQDKISQEAALFIIARPAGVTAGPPAAVKRIPGPLKFPVTFSLSGADSMMPGTSFTGKFNVSARVAQSGSATPVNPGDLVSSAKPKAVTPGSSVHIVLDEVKK